MISIRYADKQTKDLIAEVYAAALKYFEINEDLDIAVNFVGVGAMRRLNNQYRGIDKSTDVLSFPNIEINLPYCSNDYKKDIDPDTGRVFLGDIIISGKAAKEQAERFGHSMRRETAFLALHGILHLLGFDHMDKDEETIMIQHQDNLLNALGVLR